MPVPHPLASSSTSRYTMTDPRYTPPAPPAGVWIDYGPALPDTYGQDRITLLVRDPFCVFAYWELTGPHAETLPKEHGWDVFRRGQWKVRLFDGSRLVKELDAARPLGTWYFNVDSDRSYRAELGLDLGGKWVTVASSREARTPRAGISPIIDEAWAITEAEMYRQLGVDNGGWPEGGWIGVEGHSGLFTQPTSRSK